MHRSVGGLRPGGSRSTAVSEPGVPPIWSSTTLNVSSRARTLARVEGPLRCARHQRCHPERRFGRRRRNQPESKAPYSTNILPSCHPERGPRAVQEALINSPRVLVILSPAAVNSTNVEDEVSYALEKNKTVIPVLYRDSEVPYRTGAPPFSPAFGERVGYAVPISGNTMAPS
jgi:TIR domain